MGHTRFFFIKNYHQKYSFHSYNQLDASEIELQEPQPNVEQEQVTDDDEKADDSDDDDDDEDSPCCSQKLGDPRASEKADDDEDSPCCIKMGKEKMHVTLNITHNGQFLSRFILSFNF
jgi:hypothetical protein